MSASLLLKINCTLEYLLRIEQILREEIIKSDLLSEWKVLIEGSKFGFWRSGGLDWAELRVIGGMISPE
jgi:hypothetical protein